MASQTIVVFGGGNALGSYLAGAYKEMSLKGIRPDWIIGASAGAITGAIIAGNPPELRLPRLREFWAEATIATTFAAVENEKIRQYYNGWHVAWAALFGRPTIFQRRWPGLWSMLPGTPNDVAVYDHAPLRATLERLVDFERLRRSEIRFTLCCVDVENGREVRFDNRRDDIRADHLLASAAITPVFPPVEIDGRMLCDPAYVNNTPLDVAFIEPPACDTLCIAVELFSLQSPRPKSLDATLERTQDIVFASPTHRAISALIREYELRAALKPDGPSVVLLHQTYRAAGHELAGKSFDFSPSSVRDRWAAGARDAEAALAALASAPPKPGLTYMPPP